MLDGHDWILFFSYHEWQFIDTLRPEFIFVLWNGLPLTQYQAIALTIAIVNWTHGNQFGSEIFLCLKQNAFQNAIRRMLTILFRPQCVKTSIVIAHWIAYGSITYGGQGFNCLFFPKHNSLTHLPVDKMAAISQMIVSDAFSWMKSFVFWLKFHWSLFLRV